MPFSNTNQIGIEESSTDSLTYDEFLNELKLDPRTGKPPGKVSEAEIVDERSNQYATSVALKVRPEDVAKAPALLKNVVDSSNDVKEYHTDIANVAKAAFLSQELSAKGNLSMTKYMNTGDERYREEAENYYLEAKKELSKVPETEDSHGLIYNSITGAVGQVGYLKSVAEEKIGAVAGSTAAGTATGTLAGLVAAGAGVVEAPAVLTAAGIGAIVGAKTGIAANMFDSMYNQGQGEIFSRLYKATSDYNGSKPEFKPYTADGDSVDVSANTEAGGGSTTKDTMPRDIAKAVAQKWGLPYAASESVSNLNVIFNVAGVSSKIRERIAGIALEGGTEGLQELIVQLAEFDAQKQWAERRGEKFDLTMSDAIDAYEIHRAVKYGTIATAGIGIGGVAAKTAIASGKLSVDAVRAIENHTRTLALEKRAKEIALKDEREAKELAKADGAPLVEVPSNDITSKEQALNPEFVPTNKLVDVVPITESEVIRERSQINATGTMLTDQHMNSLALENDDTTLDTQLDVMLDEAEKGGSDSSSEFMVGIRILLPEDQANAVESILNARASALGMTPEQFIDSKGLKFELDTTNEQGLLAVTEFKSNTDIVIKAFQGANVSSVIHELAHVFSIDVGKSDRAVLNKWLGLDSNGKWGVTEHEKFARAFERYITEGAAPSSQLQSVFTKFATWMLNIYKAIQGSDIDIQLNQDVRNVFDKLLVKQQDGKQAVDNMDLTGMRLEQRQSPEAARDEESYQDFEKRLRAFNKAARYSLTQYNKEVEKIKTNADLSERGKVKEQLKAQIRAMQKAFDAGDMHGYDIARARMKAMFARQVKRANIQKRHTILKNRIKSRLRKALAKVQGGRLQSGMDKKTYQQLLAVHNEIVSIGNRPPEIVAAYEKYIVGQQGVMPIKPEEVLRNAYLDGAVSRNKFGLEILTEVYKTINDLIMYGRSRSPYTMNLIEANNILQLALPEINGGNTVDLKTLTPERAHLDVRKKQKSIREKIATTTLGKDFIFGFGGMLNMISGYANSPVSVLESRLNFFNEKQKKMSEVRSTLKLMQDAYCSIYGIKGQAAFHRKLNNDVKPQFIIGTPEGKKWSKSELRTLYMYTQVPKLFYRLRSMGISNAVRLNIDSILTVADKEWAQAQMTYYNMDETYNPINDVYAPMFGVNLPRRDKYVPLRSQALDDMAGTKEADKHFSQFQHDDYFRRTPTSSGRLKKANLNADKAKLHIVGDISLLHSYIEEMAHFKAYAPKARVAHAVLTNSEFKNAVIVEYGKGAYTSLMQSFSDTMADSADSRNNYPLIDRFRGAIIVSQIGASVSVMGKQLISVVNYWDKMPTGAYLKNLALFFKNPIKNLAEMQDLEYIKNRRSGIDRDLKAVVNSPEYKRWMLNPTYQNFMTLNVAIGDKLAIAIGGWAYQNYLQTVTNPITGVLYTKEEAIQQAMYDSNQTQQSSDVEQLSRLQLGSSLIKLMTMYSTGPVQAIRQEINAVKAYAGKRISTKQLVKTLFIYHVLVPFMYSSIGAAMVGADFEDEDTWWDIGIATTLGPFGVAYNAGEAVYGAARAAFGLKRYQNLGPFADVGYDIAKFFKNINDLDNLEFEDWTKAFESVAALFGYGIPAARVTRMVENAAEGNIPGAIFARKPE